MLFLHFPYEFFEVIEESGIIVFLDMPVIPKSRSAHLLPRAKTSKPVGTRLIRRRFVVAAQQGDGITLDVPSHAVWSRDIRYGNEQEYHIREVFADSNLEWALALAHCSWSGWSASPALDHEFGIAPLDRISDEKSKDGATMIPATRIRRSYMLTEPPP